MASPIEFVQRFLAEFSEDMEAAIGQYFTDATVWENVGLATTTGAREAVALISAFHSSMSIASLHIDILAIAADGSKVLTERIDHLYNDAGEELSAPMVMGIFEVEGERIIAWRDYFNSAEASALMKG